MKNLFIKKLIFLLFISLNSIARDGTFSFTISSPVTTTAGVFKNESVLVRTLRNNVDCTPGTYTKYWDGTDDNGAPITYHASSYKVNILSYNVQHKWLGTVCNSYTDMKDHSSNNRYSQFMKGISIMHNIGYFYTGYCEGLQVLRKCKTATSNQAMIFTT